METSWLPTYSKSQWKTSLQLPPTLWFSLQVTKKCETHTHAHTGRTSHRNSGSSHTGTSCRKDGLGDHMAGSCTPDWRSYLEQEKRVLRLTQKVLSAVEVIFRTAFCGEYTFFKLDFCPQPAKKGKTDVEFKLFWFKICWGERDYYQIKIYYYCNQWWYHACASFFSFEVRFLHQPMELDGSGPPSLQIHTP